MFGEGKLGILWHNQQHQGEKKKDGFGVLSVKMEKNDFLKNSFGGKTMK